MSNRKCKRNKFYKNTNILFFISIFIIFSIFASTNLLKANDEVSGYFFRVVNNDDNTAADIVGDASALEDGVKIKQITGPDGTLIDKDQAAYRVYKNDVYTFTVDFTTKDGEQTENIQVKIESLKALNSMTIKDLKLKKSAYRASSPISVPMYTDDKINFIGNYSFPGGSIEGISDQTFQGLPYTFAKAEIEIREGASLKSYPINYYDEVDGNYYYSIANTNGLPSDFDIAYEVPQGANISFYFQLNTQEYTVHVNDRQAEGFQLNFLSGIKRDDTGSLNARYHSLVKIELTYPSGYYVENAPADKSNVGIVFSNSSLQVSSVRDNKERTIIYTFTYPDEPLTMTVAGDPETTGLIYGIYDGTSSFQPKESGQSWWKATDVDGNYTAGDPYYGADFNNGQMRVIDGTSKNILVNGTSKAIATGTFDSSQDLDFEYRYFRFNQLARPPYFFWPSPILNISYFPNGTDYSTGTPITETFQLWDPSWRVDPSAVPADTPIVKQYTAQNGAKITITVKRAVYPLKIAAGGIIELYPPDYTVHVKIENMKNSFYLRTQGSGSVQGPHYFRELENVSVSADDSYFYNSGDKEDGGADPAGIQKKDITVGGMFLDKLALYNQNMPNGSRIPWEAGNNAFFKFHITPKWGYTNPRIESYEGTSNTPVMTNKPIEVEREELAEANPGTAYDSLEYGKYSWFHPDQTRSDISPFQYSLYMSVGSLTSKHDMRAIDIKTDKITGVVTNNSSFPISADQPNQIIEGDGTFDLLTKDHIIFSNDFQAPKQDGKIFVGFIAHIKAPGNPLLPADYERVLYKDLANTEYFRPGDSINVSDYFRRDSEALLNTWNTTHSFTDNEKNRLAFFMYTKEMQVTIELVYRTGGSAEGDFVTGYVNKYMQNIEDPSLTYLSTPSDTKSVSMISGAHIIFSDFAHSFLNTADGYTYYLNMNNTTSLKQVPPSDQEVARVAYDRGLTVEYAQSDGSPFTGLSDTAVYKTYNGSNRAIIKYPDESQYPLGKAFDYWTVEELDNHGNWITKPNVELKESTIPTTYDFSSGICANNKSIRLKAVWKDIMPDAYISIPKTIRLSEQGSNLPSAKDYAGAKVTIAYQSVNGSDKQVYVDVLKTFELSLVGDESKKIAVHSYDENGNLLTAPGINEKYARIGEFGSIAGSTSKNIWFNTPSLKNNDTYAGTFAINSNPLNVGQSVLFYISAVAS